MKSPTLTLVAALAFLLGGCGKSEETVKPLKESTEPKINHEVRANKISQQAARDRHDVMKKITNVLKPLREPAEVLAKEAELKALFDEHAAKRDIAAAEGIEGRILEELTALLVPNEYRDTRAEFQQYVLLVKQLGPEQRAMMNRLMGTDEPADDSGEDLAPGIE